MAAKTYEELFWDKVNALHAKRADFQVWQCEMEIKREYPGLFQTVFGHDAHERCMGALDFHLAEGCSVAEAQVIIARLAPELQAELELYDNE